MQTRFKLIILIISLGGGLAFWFLPQGFKTQTGGPVLRMQLSAEPVTLDYSLAEDGVSFRVLSALMVGLVSYDRNYKIKLEIAETMEKLDGGKRYRFKLKPWTWSDGKTVTAQDFAFAFKRTLDPSTPAKLADLLFFIRGARDFKKGVLKDFSKVGISASSEREIEFVLDSPVGFFPHVLTLPIGYPQREDLVKKHGVRRPERAETTGPYRISKWIHDQRIELERSPTYRQSSSSAAKGAVFSIVPEEATAVNLFENGKLDVLFKVPSFDLARLRQRGVVHDFPYFATYYLAFNQRHAPWHDKKARLALAQSIDRQAIVHALGGFEKAATSWIPHGFPGFNESIGIKRDPQEAKKIWLASSGRSADPLVVGYDSSSKNQMVLERVQSDLKQVLGVSLRFRTRDWKTYVRELSTDTPPLYRFGWLSPFVDAYANLVVFHSENPNNYTGWKNPKYDALLAQIAALDSESPARLRLIDEAQKILLEEDVVVVPLFHYVQPVIVSPRIKGFWVNGIGTVDLMNVELL